ncbi:hypothetical protein M431DRAFT_490843 [Trichoderma harzianum CBS 226.95]|uniref:Uncharacterized protein n=1 Tax=Trichoderma harzianum CBS 226.95 TaxID=983964 RepID=A0A2T4AQ92_TRIHA|nr:hypothetical protein M431DRAFT_490843 [Trichoderma harzianum CBS 226.95]PTB59236.1 hypothetical protein M431DRAFT_490843 [Trichoderma harzianum CBS 226.95]
MYLARDSGGRSELLFAIHPAFVDALPVASPSQSVQERNHITLLRHEIANIMQVFDTKCAEQDLSEDTFCICIDSLNSILVLFEDLVVGKFPARNCNSSDELHAEFPKLVALKYQISTGELVSASFWVSFGGKPRQHNTTLIVQHFNQTISKLFSTINYESNTFRFYEIEDDYESDKALLRNAEELAAALGAIFEQLKALICLKDPEGHNSYVRLSEFAKNELQMMISICGHRSLWQHVVFHMETTNNCNMKHSWIKEICSELTRSYRKKRVLSMTFDGKGFCKNSTSEAHGKESAILSTETLSNILQKEEQLKQGKASHYKTIRKKDKRRLSLLLSNSLIHLSGSALLRNPWSANTIHIRQRKDGFIGQDTAPEAYMTYAFNSQIIEENAINEDLEPGDPYVLGLAKLLLELELGKEITVLDEDIDEITGKTSLYMAITRIHGDLDQYLEDMDPFIGIIDSCLQICTDLYDMDLRHTNSKDYYHKLREEVLTKVIRPLNQRDKIISKHWKFVQRSRTSTSESISSSVQWLKEFDFINRDMGRLISVSRVTSKNRNIRLAILDTGCDLTAPCMAVLPGVPARLVGHWRDFHEGSTEPVDEDAKQHGTALTALLFRVAFNVDIYVGRVTKDQADLPNSTQNISKAIHYAAAEWKADVITMSFGFPFIVDEIEYAVTDVNRGRRKDGKSEVVFFAAANNDGLNSEEMFPASLETVISVRGTDHTGAFINKFNPIPRPQKARGLLYGTLGQNVPYDIGDNGAQMSGCSVATPILAGIVATIVQYANYTVGMDAETITRLLTKDGILQVLEHISVGDDFGRRRYSGISHWGGRFSKLKFNMLRDY